MASYTYRGQQITIDIVPMVSEGVEIRAKRFTATVKEVSLTTFNPSEMIDKIDALLGPHRGQDPSPPQP